MSPPEHHHKKKGWDWRHVTAILSAIAGLMTAIVVPLAPSISKLIDYWIWQQRLEVMAKHGYPIEDIKKLFPEEK